MQEENLIFFSYKSPMEYLGKMQVEDSSPARSIWDLEEPA